MRKITLLFSLLISSMVFSQIKIIKTDELIEIGKDNSPHLPFTHSFFQ